MVILNSRYLIIKINHHTTKNTREKGLREEGVRAGRDCEVDWWVMSPVTKLPEPKFNP